MAMGVEMIVALARKDVGEPVPASGDHHTAQDRPDSATRVRAAHCGVGVEGKDDGLTISALRFLDHAV